MNKTDSVDYFSARNVSANMYENAPLAAYFAEVIAPLKNGARILDFGCGFGQTLIAIKNKHFAFNGGGGRDKDILALWY